MAIEELTGGGSNPGARKTVIKPTAPQTRFRSPEQATLHNRSGTGRAGGFGVVGARKLLHSQKLPLSRPKYSNPEQKVAQVWYVRELEVIFGPLSTRLPGLGPYVST